MKAPRVLLIARANSSNGRLAKLLEQVGFSVEYAQGTPEGVRKLGSAQLDLVITEDVSTQGKHANPLGELGGITERVPVVVVLNEGEVYNVAELVRAGASDVISQPFELDQVLRTLCNVLEQAGRSVDLDLSHLDGGKSRSVFGQKFRELRKLTGISVKELAQIFQCSPSYIYNIERGIRDPQTPFIIKACEVYGVSCDYMLRNRLQKDVIEKQDEIELISRYRKLPAQLRKAFLSQFRFQFRLYEKLSETAIRG